MGKQLEDDPHVPKDVVEGQARLRVGLWTDLFDRDESIHKVFRSIRNLGPLESGSQPKAIRLSAKTKTKES